MDALVKEAPGKGLTLKRVPVPQPGIGEVQIKIHKTAICGTDVHIYNWDPWSQQHIRPPMVIGHEYVGEITALGPGVSDYSIGDIVSGEGHIVCGHCRNCRAGNGQWCKFTRSVGVDRDGAFAEYLCIPETNVIRIPAGIPEDIVSFFDAYGNATHTATMFDVVGEDVLITGAGPIGMMAVGICRQNGARRVIVTDVNQYRLDIAKQMGAHAVVNLAHDKLEDAMREQGMVEGFDVGLEMSGNGAALNQLLKSMRNGGKVALLGIAGPGTVIDWNDVIFKGLTLQGIYGRKMYETWYKLMAMIEAGLDLSPIITHRFHYTEYEKGFEAMNSGHSGKVILDWAK
ncbi:MAG: L-threonine 3-dehydrogenase [Christensenellaceae bacterium]|nr:L-threonine 3-dehydrogenase [Christensenellaceae bacterium]PWM62212.1 MAG: L-threonine 3-dehydrogenase [Clostridia bacterium]